MYEKYGKRALDLILSLGGSRGAGHPDGGTGCLD